MALLRRHHRFDAARRGYSTSVIEMREESAAPLRSAVVIRCPESGGALGVERCIDLALRVGQTHLIVDLGDRDGADADLLGALYRSGRRMRDSDGRLSVVCGDPRLRRLLDVTLLSHGFGVYATREEALAG